MSEDWNETVDTGFAGPGFKQAVGRGRGRGLLNVDKENNIGHGSTFNSAVNGTQNWGDSVPGQDTFGKKAFGVANNTTDDWDEGKPAQPAFGKKPFGAANNVTDDWSDNRNVQGGFGKKSFGTTNNVGSKPSSSGFGRKPFGASNNAEEDWGDNSGQSQEGFGRKIFGSAPNGGSDTKVGFGRGGVDNTASHVPDVPFGGGFGRRGVGQQENNTSSRTGDRGCYKCGEQGHMSRDCPQGGGGGGRSGACFKCGEQGHMSRDCPQGGGGGGGRSGACYKCGEEGHISRDCPQGGGGGGGGRSGACYKCGEEGHISRDCPQGGGGGGGRSGACYKCGEEGHISRDCPQGGGGGGSGRSGACYKCGEDGHMSRDCPQGGGSNRPGQGGEKPPENYIPPPPPEDEDQIFQSVQQGINFDKYDEIKVFVTGREAPQKGLSSFSEANLHEIILQNVKKAKYLKPTPVQKHAINVIMCDRDLMACAQTGSGKTAAFLLPVLTKMIQEGLHGSSFSEIQEPQAIVIGPTRELVVQIYNEARKFAFNTMLRPVVVYGGTSVGHQLQQISKGAHMVVGTPGRLKDFIERGKISLSKVRFLILDEADRMLDMGFEPIVRQIVEQMGMTSKSERQTLMFSATFPEEIQKLASDFLKDHIFITVGRVGGANTDIKQVVYQVEKNEKREKLVSILNETGTGRSLVFVEQKRSTDFLAAFLCQFDFPATSIHGDRYQSQREEALADFKSGRKPILVATSVASRGLDIRGVEHVINFDIPKSIDEYVHRIGRTGRCGNLGKATSFFDPQVDGEIAQPLVNILADAEQEVPDWLVEMAESNSIGFSRNSGKYGGKDIRRKQFKNDQNTDFSSRGFNEGAVVGGAVDDEEVWDD